MTTDLSSKRRIALNGLARMLKNAGERKASTRCFDIALRGEDNPAMSTFTTEAADRATWELSAGRLDTALKIVWEELV